MVEVHDIEGRLSRIKGLLAGHGFLQEVEQDQLLEATNQYTVYARRASKEDEGHLTPPGISERSGRYWSSEQLTGALREHVLAKLPEYMVPGAYVCLEKLPLTANGKLDRKALPAPETEAYRARDYDEPVGEIERAVAEIWTDVLKVERVGRHDNFFELGGHSLLAVRVIARMRRAGFEVDVRSVFATSTLAELAAEVAPKPILVEVPPNGIRPGCEVITPEMLPLVQLTSEEIEKIVNVVSGGAANVQDIYPLAPLQEGILFHHLMSGESDPYMFASGYSFDNRQRLENYLEAMQAVIDRHDILRTGVVWEGLSEPVQVVWRKAVLHVEEVALEVGAGDGVTQLRARYNPQSYRMDVRQAPLLRVAIARDEEKDRWLIMLLQHHLIGDHTTTEGMQEEIEAYLLGRGDRLPTPQPFRNMVAQARLGISREEHEAYFTAVVSRCRGAYGAVRLVECARGWHGDRPCAYESGDRTRAEGTRAGPQAWSERGELVSRGLGAGDSPYIGAQRRGVWDGAVRTDAGWRRSRTGDGIIHEHAACEDASRRAGSRRECTRSAPAVGRVDEARARVAGSGAEMQRCAGAGAVIYLVSQLSAQPGECASALGRKDAGLGRHSGSVRVWEY